MCSKAFERMHERQLRMNSIKKMCMYGHLSSRQWKLQYRRSYYAVDTPDNKKINKKNVGKKKQNEIQTNIILMEVFSRLVFFFLLKRSSCVHKQLFSRRVAHHKTYDFVFYLFLYIFNEFYTSYLPLVLKYNSQRKKKVLRVRE